MRTVSSQLLLCQRGVTRCDRYEYKCSKHVVQLNGCVLVNGRKKAYSNKRINEHTHIYSANANLPGLFFVLVTAPPASQSQNNHCAMRTHKTRKTGENRVPKRHFVAMIYATRGRSRARPDCTSLQLHYLSHMFLPILPKMLLTVYAACLRVVCVCAQ